MENPDVTLESVRTQEHEILAWHEKLNQHGVLLFVGILAIIGVTETHLRVPAFVLTLFFWVADVIENARKLNIAPFQLKKLKPADYEDDLALQKEIVRAKANCCGLRSHFRCARFWLASIFLLAVLVTEMVKLQPK